MFETPVLIILGTILGLIVGFFVFKLLSKKTGDEDKGPFLLIQGQLDNLSRALDFRLAESIRQVNESVGVAHKSMQSQVGESYKIVADLTEKLTRLEETNKQVVNFTAEL